MAAKINPFLISQARDKICSVWWQDADVSEQRSIMFKDGDDLLELLQHQISPEKWFEIWLRAPQMAPDFPSVDDNVDENRCVIDEELEHQRDLWKAFLNPQRVYLDTLEWTLPAFAGRVNKYCRGCVDTKRRLQDIPETHAVPVALRLDVIRRNNEDWELPVNTDGNRYLSFKRAGLSDLFHQLKGSS